MVEQIDILQCAILLLKYYGIVDATYRAGLRADACLEQGDVKGQKVWLQVIAAIKDMAGPKRSSADVIY